MDKQEFQKLVEYIEQHKEDIAKEKQDNELKMLPANEFGYWIQLNKEIFVFDKESWKFFNEEFNLLNYKLSVEYTPKGKYLIRTNSFGYQEYFHRLFMKKEVESFAMDNNLPEQEVEVHHKSFCSQINTKESLQVISKAEHKKITKEIEKMFSANVS